MRKEPTNRTKKAIVSTVRKLADKYGHDVVRRVINKHFQNEKEKRYLEMTIQAKEKELAKLKKTRI